MIHNETNLVVADNSGARSVRVFRQYGGSRRKVSSIGDVVLCAVKDAVPNAKVKKSDVVKGVIVRVKHPLQRKDGSTISFAGGSNHSLSANQIKKPSENQRVFHFSLSEVPFLL